MKPSKSIVFLVMLAACKGGGSKEAPAPVAADAAKAAPVVDAAAAAAVVDAAAAGDAGPALADRPRFRPDLATEHTAETMEKLFAAIAACTVADLDSKEACPEKTLAEEVGWRISDSSKVEDWADRSRMRMAVAEKMMRHEAPSVRVYALSHVHTHGDAYDEIAAVIAGEQDLEALRRMALSVAGRERYTPKLAEQVLRLADHPDADIRRYVLTGLGQARELPGAFEMLRAHAESDAEEDTRKRSCEALGELGDARALPVFQALLVPTTAAPIYDACLGGLIAMWMHPDNAHQKAYKMTLALVARPDQPVVDSLTSLSNLARIPGWMESDPEYAKAKKWVKLRDIEKALVALASAKKAAPAAREAAVDTLVDFGAKKKVFQAIRKTLPAEVPDEDPLRSLADDLDEAIGEAP